MSPKLWGVCTSRKGEGWWLPSWRTGTGRWRDVVFDSRLAKYLLLRSVVDQKTVTIEIVQHPTFDDMKIYFLVTPFSGTYLQTRSAIWPPTKRLYYYILYNGWVWYFRLPYIASYRLQTFRPVQSRPVTASIKSLRCLIKELRASFLCSTFIAKLFLFSSIPFQVLGEEYVIVICYVKVSSPPLNAPSLWAFHHDLVHWSLNVLPLSLRFAVI